MQDPNQPELKSLLLSAPEDQLDKSAHPLIQKWPDDKLPSPLEILEVLDHVVYGGSASDFVVMVLENFLDIACKEANTTYEEVVAKATWRKNPPT